MPLPVVAAVLSGAPGALDDVRAEHEAELVRRRSALAALERVMVEGLPATPVRVVAEPARSVAVVREVAAGAADVSRATSAAVARVLREVPPTGPPELIGERIVRNFVTIWDATGGGQFAAMVRSITSQEQV
ncbi:hypothetical protein K7G98_28455, partial [Saccharothrix sp. MB29]|nr:hypothetical protein [Saccharothrix sp. MB29]